MIKKIGNFIYNYKEDEKYKITTFMGIKLTTKKNNNDNNIINNFYSKSDMMYILKRITPKAYLDYIEIHLVEHCNLNCQCCSHFSQLAEKEFLDISIFEKDIKRLYELTNGYLNKIHLMGGEPLLHPNCSDFFYIVRKYFKNTEIKLITNAILLNKQNDLFWKACNENNVSITPTKYPININWDEIFNLCNKHNVKAYFFNEEDLKTEIEKKSYQLKIDPNGNQNPELSFMHCGLANNCIFLSNGKLYTCSEPGNIRHFNKFFNTNIPITEYDYIDIHKANNINEILNFLAKPIPFCKYCNVSQRKYLMDWKISNKSIDEYIK